MKEKESIMKLNFPKDNSNQEKEELKLEINNMWEYGITPKHYNLLPIKGNNRILFNLNKDIKTKSPSKICPKLNYERNIDYKSDIYFKKEKIRKKEKKYEHDYNNKYFLKIALENFNFNNNKFTCYNLLNYLLKKDFSSKYCSQIIKALDKNCDGYIDIIDLIKYLLYELKHKATKLVLKYLYIKIYKEMNLSSCKEFFNMYNFKLKDIINNEKFIKFMKDIYIDFPLTKQILYELNLIYPQPLIYEYFTEQIDVYKADKYINNIQYYQKEKENINYNRKKFEQLIEKNMLRDISLKNEFNSIIEECNETMSYSEYLSSFANPLGFDNFFSLIIFQLLKTFSDNGEQIISKNDIFMFFDSYSLEDKKNKIKKKDIKEIIKYNKKLGAPLKYAFEIIPFRKNGLIPSSELIKYLCKFYGNTIQKSDLINIVFFIDKKRKGIISYEQIQKFLNKYCGNYSNILELQIISCNIYKYNFPNAESYFNQNEIKTVIKNNYLINIEKHNDILKNICSNDLNKENLFLNLAKKGEKYNLQKLIDLLNIYLEIDSNCNYIKSDEEKEKEITLNILPNKSMIENVLKEINLGVNGNISMNEFIMKFKKEYRNKLIEKLDKDKKGFISFPELISKLTNIYGTDIDLNYKLCAQYLFKKYIKEPNEIREYIIKKANASYIQEYITHKNTYNNFMFAFCNNKILFETFYMIYKEKKGKHIGMLNLSNLEQFIIINNKLVSSGATEISNNIGIKEILIKNMINIKDVINHINIEKSNLDKNFTIKEKYIRNLLKTKFKFIKEDIDLICQIFNSEEDIFDLKKFFLYENEDIKKYDIILYEEILPKIRAKIKDSKINSYKEYKLKIFNNIDYLDICELFSKFNELYEISLYNCLLLMKEETFFSTEKFFTETNLKEEFKIKDIEPSLKLALIRLNEFFGKNVDKIKVFKEFDLDRNGKLSSDEFITALNSLDNLNLNDNQKYKILNLIDTNKDGKIDINEFIKFINNLKDNINNEGEININSTLFKKKISINNNTSSEQDQSNIITERTQLQKIINYNKNLLKKNNDIFLNHIIILQESLFNDSLEKELNKEDPNNKGIISEKKFKNILKNRLVDIKKKNLQKLIDLANKGVKNEENKENEIKKINYKNFLKNLSNYRFNDKLVQNNKEEIILPKIN